MITIHVERNYEENWLYISHVTVEVEDKKEKERIEEILEREVVGETVDGFKWIPKAVAGTLGIDVKNVQVDLYDSF